MYFSSYIGIASDFSVKFKRSIPIDLLEDLELVVLGTLLVAIQN